MATLVPGVAALAVSTIYCLWHAYRENLLQRKRILHERVAFMLWRAAEIDKNDEAQVCA